MERTPEGYECKLPMIVSSNKYISFTRDDLYVAVNPDTHTIPTGHGVCALLPLIETNEYNILARKPSLAAKRCRITVEVIED